MTVTNILVHITSYYILLYIYTTFTPIRNLILHCLIVKKMFLCLNIFSRIVVNNYNIICNLVITKLFIV